jgi:hypothetical protein
MAIYRDQIEAWAKAHGFRLTTRGELACPYKDGDVIISFTEQKVKARYEVEGRETRLGSAFFSSPTLKVEEGVLAGIGLVTPFINGAIERGEFPAWWSEEYKARFASPASGP